MATTSIGGIPVEAQLPAAYRANYWSIREIPTTYSDEALLGFLRDHSVIRVRRHFRKITADVQEATDEVVLHFHETSEARIRQPWIVVLEDT